MKIVGRSIDNKLILCGKFVFDMVDSKGMPLDLLNQLLEENRMGFDVKGFIFTAKSSKNYANKERLRILLKSNMLRENKQLEKYIDICIEKVYENTI